MTESEEAKRLLTDPAFQNACEMTERVLKDQMAMATSEAELQLAHRKIKVLYLLIEQLAVAYETAVYDAKNQS